MPAMPEVEILLASCYGASFVRERIESILTQDAARLAIVARDRFDR
jgi:hypothetical protein